MSRALLGKAEGLLRHVRAICGPRLPGSPGEARAARYVRTELGRLGLSPQVEEFQAVADMNWFPLSAAMASLVGLAIFPWLNWLGVIVTALSPVLMWWALTRADSPLRALLPRVGSRSVFVRIPPRGELRSTVAIVAHLDANRCRLAWRAGGARAIRIGSAFTLLVQASIPPLLAAAALTGDRRPLLLALLGGLYSLADLGVLLWELRRPPSPGANDNAASVAVALALAERLTETPLACTEVWLLFTGAEESDHRGIKRLLSRHPELGDAWFLVLEGVGAGQLSYLVREGVLRGYRPDPAFRALVAGVGKKLRVGPQKMAIVCETQTLRRLGLRAITLAGYDPSSKSLPRWHTCDDLPQALSLAALLRAKEFLEEVLAALDRED